MVKRNSEGLIGERLLMVLSSFSPLFIIWAIRGTKLMADNYFWGICAGFVLLPYFFLWFRIRTAKKNLEKKEICIGEAKDNREFLLVYLFAMLLPFYAADLTTWRDFSAAWVALAFIVFLFCHLNLHYVNIVFAILGYRVFTIYPLSDSNPLSGKENFVLITRRVTLARGEKIETFRISDTVFLEVDK